MILQVINSLRTGGAEKFVVEITLYLKETGHQVEVLVFSREETIFTQMLHNHGIKIRYTVSEYFLSPLNIITFLNVVFSRRYKVIHTHLTYAQLWLSMVSFFNFGRKKLFTTEHSANNNRRGSHLLHLVDKLIYSRYKNVICISQSVKSTLLDWLLPENQNKYIVISNCVDVDYFSTAEPLNKNSLGIDSDASVVMMIGRFCDAKDQPTLIRAVESLPDNYVCVLVGDGETLTIVQNNVQKKSRIFFTGARPDIAQLLKMCDIYVQSSHWEGLPTTVLEAMAAQKVVFGSDVLGVNDIIPKAQLFEHENYHQLAVMICGLTKECEAKIIGKQNQLLSGYSLSVVTEQLLSCYKS